MSGGPALELRGVRKVYGRFVALDGIDLAVERGEVLGFLGPNGAGKTTTLRIVTGLLRATAGQVRVCGLDLGESAQALEAKRRVGFISDRPFLYEKLTGGEFLRFVGGLWGMEAREIEEASARWLEHFDLAGWAGEPIEAYSHGMRQRLLLASTLLHRPEVLIMDEPMVGLDPRGAVQLKQTVRELASERGLAVVLSTHTLDVVEQVCDRVAIIHRGRIIAAGMLEAVRAAHGLGGERLEELFLRLTEGGAAGFGLSAAPSSARGPESASADEPARARAGGGQ